MEKFLIKGGGKLKGIIEVKGAKNAALKAFAAALLTKKPVVIRNVPDVEDVSRIIEIMSDLGVKVAKIAPGKYKIDSAGITGRTINPEISKKLRASIALTAPLLARFGEVSFPHPGGCVIGERPIDVFIDGYRALGAKVNFAKGTYSARAPNGLRGASFVFHNVSVTGTESLIMAAVLAKGETRLKNCACEPEIECLARFLNQFGAKIEGAGTPYVKIVGVKSLKGGTYDVIPDRIEAGTFAIMAAATKSPITITNCNPGHLDALWSLFKKMGITVKITKNSVTILPAKKLTSVHVKTHEYPGFPTDLQAPICVLLTQAEGQGLVHETIYDGRLFWVEDLKRMGADVLMCDPHRISIHGATQLRGREIESPDLRAGMAFVIAALCAKGNSIINNIYQIDRGYEKIEERLKKLGANIKRI